MTLFFVLLRLEIGMLILLSKDQSCMRNFLALVEGLVSGNN